MCSLPQDTMDKLDTTVRQFLDEGRMFTGYDVTIETRTREHMSLRHQDVREGVHELDVLRDALDYGWDTKNGAIRWTKTQKTMPGGWAWVFHPTNLDANNYQPRNPKQASSSTATSVPSLSLVADGATNDSGGEQDDGTFAPDYRHRLMVPTKFLKEAGLKAGDTVYVLPDSSTNMVLIAKDSDAIQSGNIKITTQKVERNGDLRLSSKTLKAADMEDNKFMIETTEKDLQGQKSKVIEVKATK